MRSLTILPEAAIDSRSVAPDFQGLLSAEALGISFGHQLLQGRKQDVRVDVHGRIFSTAGAHAGSVTMLATRMHEARHVGVPDAVELPLAELDGCLDHCFCPGQAAGGELFPERLGRCRRRRSAARSARRVLQRLAAPCAIVGGQLCAASPMMTMRPRFHGPSTRWVVNHV